MGATIGDMIRVRRSCGVYFLVLVLLFLGSVTFQMTSARSTERVRLYMKDRATGQLVSRKVVIPSATDPCEKLFWILKELISGPTGARYERIFSPDIDVQSIIIRRGTAYISFGWSLVESLHQNPSLAVAAIVNSALLNVRGLEEVKILIEGVEPVSTFGNVSLLETFTRPL
jgi:hypothetical protein